MADTDIELSVKLDTKNISSSARNLRKEIKNIFDVQEGKALDTRMQSLQATMSKTAAKSRQVAKEMQTLAQTKMPTKEYTDTNKELEKMYNASDRAEQKVAKLQQALKQASTPKQRSNINTKLGSAVEDANKLDSKVVELEQHVKELEASGKAFTLGSSSEQYAKLVDQSRDLYNQMVVTVNKAYDLDPALKQAVRDMHEIQEVSAEDQSPELDAHGLLSPMDSIREGLSLLKKSFTDLPVYFKEFNKSIATNALQKFSDLLDEVGPKLLSFGSNLAHGLVKKGMNIFNKSLHKSNKSLGTGFLKILRYAIGLRSLYTLFSKLRSAIAEGVNNLARWNNGNNKVNQSLSMLKSSLTQMKNAVGVVAASILNIVGPALNQMIQWITQLSTAIARLIATVSGAKTFIQAKTVQENYAKSLDKSAKAAKGLSSSIDELNVLTDSGSSGGTDPNSMFEEVPLDPLSFKEMLKNIDWDKIKAEAEELGRHFADILNGIFSDEELAALLGQTIGEMINTAIHFAYGFVDELQWLQMGRWFGTLIKNGIETIEWDLLGQTIGLALNGITNSIIGFFQTYPAGLLGQSIATMFNRAVATINATNIGIAIGDIIGGVLAEFTAFLKAADIQTASSKAFEIFKSVLTEPLLNGDKTLGNLMGEALAEIINFAIDVVIGSDVSGAIDAFNKFWSDMLYSAITDIEWINLASALGIIIIDIIEQVAFGIYDAIIAMLEPLAEAIGGPAEEMFNSVKSGLETLEQPFEDAKESIKEWGDQYATTSSQVAQSSDDVIVATKKSFEELSNSATTSSTNVTTAMSSMETSIQTSTTNANQYVKTSADGMTESLGSIKDYESQSTESLNNVSTVANETDTTLQSLGVTVQDQLAEVSEVVETWYQELMENYFSYDAWSAIFTDGMILALTEQLEVFSSWWTDAMTTWMSDNDTLYFGNSIWDTKWQVIPDTYKTMWTSFLTTWKSNMEKWFTNQIDPNFTKEIWKDYGSNMQDGIYEGFKGIVSEVGGLINQVVDIFNTAMSNLATSMNDLIETFNTSATTMGVSSLPKVTWTNMSKIEIPALAQGAVIPPNKEFLAVLGDQTHGTNIEAPLDTIKQAVAEVISNEMISLLSQQVTLLQQIENKDVIIDDNKMFKTVRDKARTYKKSTGSDAFAF